MDHSPIADDDCCCRRTDEGVVASELADEVDGGPIGVEEMSDEVVAEFAVAFENGEP